MNVLKVLLKYKKEAMDTKIENNELRIELRNYKPETSPRANETKPEINDEAEAEQNFQELENEVEDQEEQDDEQDSDDSDAGPPLEGQNLLDQIAEVEMREVRNKLGLSQKVAKPKGLGVS